MFESSGVAMGVLVKAGAGKVCVIHDPVEGKEDGAPLYVLA